VYVTRVPSESLPDSYRTHNRVEIWLIIADEKALRGPEGDRRARDLAPVVAEVKAGCPTLAGIAGALNARGVPPPSRRGPWHRSAVHVLLRRLEVIA